MVCAALINPTDTDQRPLYWLQQWALHTSYNNFIIELLFYAMDGFKIKLTYITYKTLLYWFKEMKIYVF